MSEERNLQHKRAGKPHACTDERIARLVQLVEAGNYVDTACAVEGVSEAVFYKWGRVGRDAMEEYDLEVYDEDTIGEDYWPDDLRTPYHEYTRQCIKFVGAMTKATARSEAYAVTTIRKAMPTNPVAAMMWLERRFPARWRKRTQIDVGDGSDSGQAERERAALENPRAVAAMHEALEAEAGTITDALVIEEGDPTA